MTAYPNANPTLEAAELTGLLGDWSASGRGALHRRLAQALRARIVAHAVPAGARLPPERTLAAALSVSRSTLVAALDELRSEGLVVSRQGSGTAIRVHGVANTTLPASLVDRVLGDHESINLGVSAPYDASHLPDLSLDVADLLGAVPAHGYDPAGQIGLRTALATLHQRWGPPTAPEHIHVTNGAQHALDLVVSALSRPGDQILVENPTYPGMLDVIARHGLRPLGVPSAPATDLARSLASALQASRARFAYLQPAVHNPTGRVLAAGEWRALAEALDRPELTIIEDNTLADLAFTRPRPPSLAVACRSATVVSIESLSKIAWGGLRIGWLRGPAPVVERTVRLRHATDLGSAIPAQLLAGRLAAGHDDLAARRRAVLAERWSAFSALWAAHLADWELTEPHGGLSVWARLPDGDAAAFAQRAARRGVGVAPGLAACVEGGRDQLRLCFDRPPEVLAEAVSRLAITWQDTDRSPSVFG